MPQTFSCPSCSGPLPYSRAAGKTVSCSFCGQTVVVPESLRATAGATPAPDRKRRIALMAVLTLTLIGVAVINAVSRMWAPAEPTVAEDVLRALPQTMPEAIAATDLAPADASFEVVWSFGEEGIGPGRFEDARHVALDGEGAIYVGEYSGGRIQRFDATGRFLTQWTVDPEAPLRGLAAGRDGVVYVVQRGELRRYQGATGELLGTWDGPDRFRADGVYPTPEGGVLAYGSSGASSTRIVRFSRDGQVRADFDAKARSARVAVDGAGHVYVVGRFKERGQRHEAVLQYGPDGTFLNRFGSEGDGPGQFGATHGIAVDGRGRVYVSDIRGIQVFEPDGRFQQRLKVGGSVFGLAFTDDGHLILAERNSYEVRKLKLTDA